jgi:bifunctional DNA-binding transcriptional regulator/antitoxin component of YhaV-PrlF toxin-antitoxin module
MLATLRAKNQITLPIDIIKKLGIHKDDNIEITLNDKGQIILTPVVVVEKKFASDLKEALADVKKGKVSKEMSADEVLKKLGI